jgi:hypothetical protein
MFREPNHNIKPARFTSPRPRPLPAPPCSPSNPMVSNLDQDPNILSNLACLWRPAIVLCNLFLMSLEHQ